MPNIPDFRSAISLYLIRLFLRCGRVPLAKSSYRKFKIVGHTDSRGSYKLNRTLSKTRANAVRNYLVDSGISKDRIETVGLGESEPIDTNLTEKGRSN